MEPELPLQNSKVNPFQVLLAKKRSVLLAVFLVILIILIVAFFLPQSLKKPAPSPSPVPSSQVVSKPTPFPPPTAYQKGPFKCPGIPKFCQEGQDITVRGYYTGFGAKLPPNSPLYAAFDGELTFRQIDLATQPLMKKPIQPVNIIYLTNKTHALRAVYYFPGKLSKNQISDKVVAGQTIATASGETMKLYNESSLTFTLTRNDSVMDGLVLGGEKVKLTKTDFKQ